MATKDDIGLLVEPGIRERSPGRYQLRAFDKATGRQVARTFVAPRAEKGAGIRAARAELAKLRTEIAAGQHSAKKATLASLLDEFIRVSEERGRAPGTLHGYRSNAGKVKASPLGDRPLAKLTAHDLDRFYGQLQAEGMTPATVHHHHRLIRAALSQAVKWGWVPTNVALKATPPTAGRPELHPPTVVQARALVARAGTMPNTDLAAVILFAMLTGARRGEILRLPLG